MEKPHPLRIYTSSLTSPLGWEAVFSNRRMSLGKSLSGGGGGSSFRFGFGTNLAAGAVGMWKACLCCLDGQQFDVGAGIALRKTMTPVRRGPQRSAFPLDKLDKTEA